MPPPLPPRPPVSIPGRSQDSNLSLQAPFPDGYPVGITPPHSERFYYDDAFPASESPTRLRTRSAMAALPDSRAGMLVDSRDPVLAFPEPHLYRSTSSVSTLSPRQSTSRSTNAAFSSLRLYDDPSMASLASSSLYSGPEYDYASVEVTIQGNNDLSQELSNLSLDSEEALRRFQTGELLDKDQAWHRLVPSEARESLGKKEVQRQSVLFELFKAEREYVSDLETVEEVFIKGLQEASPPVIPASQLPTFIGAVFGNLAAILAHHQRMLAALFARQREQHPLIQSIADIVLETVLLSEFRTDYEIYIKHYPLSESLHRKELKCNTAYRAFLGSVSAHPRIRKRDLITFLSRPVTRLPRLTLILEQILKATDENYDHPDLETLPITLSILGDLLKSTQPGIEVAESKVKFQALCESLVFPREEIIDMDLDDESRTVVYSGPIFRVMQDSKWADLTGFLLDNYFILTQEQEEPNGQGKRYIVSRPIHLSYLRAGSFTSAPFFRKGKVEDGGLLDSFRSAPAIPMYPFTVYHASSKSTRRYTLSVASEGVRKRWQSAFVDAIGVYEVRQETNMLFYQQSLTDHFFRLLASNVVENPPLRQSGEITSAAPFSNGGRRFLAVGCAAGIYVSPRGLEDYRRVSTLANPTALTAIQTFGSKSYNKLIAHCNNSLFALSLDAIADPAVGHTGPQPIEAAMERIVPQDSPVYFFKCVQSGERVLIIYGTKKRFQISMDLQTVEVMHRSATLPRHISHQRSVQPFNEPANIPRDAYDVSRLNRNVGVCVKDGIMIMDPTNLANSTPAIVPSFADATGNASMGALKTRVHGAKPLGLVHTTSTELLVVYNVLGCYITKRGVPSRSAGFIRWETPATSYASRGNHLLLFSTLFIEVRDLSTGRIVQVIEGTNIRLLHAGGPTYGEDEAILVAMKGTKDDKNGTSERIVELLQTSPISSTPAAPVPALWDEWDIY